MKRPVKVNTRSLLGLVLAGITIACLGAPAAAQMDDPNECDVEGEFPDVIVGDLQSTRRWGKVGDITAFSVGTTSCNVGTCQLEWIRNTNHHPVIGANMFRLRDGRFEQLGQSWLKHGFFALAEDLCSPDCIDPDDGGRHLGVNCSDPYSSGLNGQQNRLGPKWQVNASTGEYVYPPANLADEGDAIFKRLQVHDADLDPALNTGALYYVEGQYTTLDDTQAGKNMNNISHREVAVEELAPGEWDINLMGETQREEPAIFAWKASDPDVVLANVDVPDDGRFWVGSRATDLGNGFWAYEYAVHNMNSHRSAGAFAVNVPAGATVQAIGFHDVDYHSGEPFDGTDWGNNGGVDGALRWATDPFTVNTNANAIRWGTLYNFRFETDLPPTDGLVTIGLHRPGTPDAVMVDAVVPDVCDDDGTCEPGEDCVSCPGDCPMTGPDLDGDGFVKCGDCDDMDPTVWRPPGEVLDVRVVHDLQGVAYLTWNEPDEPGATEVVYQTLRSENASDFVFGLACLSVPDPSLRMAADPGTAPLGGAFYYLIRAVNACADGQGPLGVSSYGDPRTGADCP